MGVTPRIPRRSAMQARIGTLRKLITLALVAATVVVILAWRSGRLGAARTTAFDVSTPDVGSVTVDSPLHQALPTFTPSPPLLHATAMPTVPPNRVGIIAGHWQFDTGAVCPDGRMEVQ